MTTDNVLISLFIFGAFCAFKSLMISLENQTNIEILRNKILEKNLKNNFADFTPSKKHHNFREKSASKYSMTQQLLDQQIRQVGLQNNSKKSSNNQTQGRRLLRLVKTEPLAQDSSRK